MNHTLYSPAFAGEYSLVDHRPVVFVTHPEFVSRQSPFQEKMGFQRKSWKAERAAWCALCFILLLATIGLFGGDNFPWSKGHVSNSELSISANRFGRVSSRSVVDIAVGRTSGSQTVIDLPLTFFDAFEILSIMPSPSTIRVADGLKYLEFAGTHPSGVIQISMKPLQPGLQTIAPRINNGTRLSVTQFVYP